MKRTRIVGFAVLAAVCQGGCGTILNFAKGDPDIYGGVQKDIQFIQTPRAGGGGVGVNPSSLVLLVPVDACLSLVADTLTLPLAVYLRQNGHASDDKSVTGGDGSHAANPRPADNADSPAGGASGQ
jgi:uncharacterized protein YceK